MPTSVLPLVEGSEGEAVRDLQRRLARAGFGHGSDEPGTFGPATVEAVAKFQEGRGLQADGVCGQQTWSALVEAGYRLGDRLLYHRTPMLRGDDVADLQRILGGLGFFGSRIDGIFGPQTAEATLDFQRNTGLTSDAICGPATVDSLARVGDRGGVPLKAGLMDRELLRAAPRLLSQRRVMIAEAGGLGALAAALARSLREQGALVEVCAHPEQSVQATEANDFVADVLIALRLAGSATCRCAYYGRPDYESVGGRRLAEQVAKRLPASLDLTEGSVTAMRLPILRETRMVAVLCDVGTPSTVVEHTAEVARDIADALVAWAADPVES